MTDDGNATEIPTLWMRVSRRLGSMVDALRRRRLPPENWYRDVWLLLITGLVALALANQESTTSTVGRNQRANTVALCSFKHDLQRRVEQGIDYLRTHPNGFPGISAATIRVGIANQQSTLKALSPLMC